MTTMAALCTMRATTGVVSREKGTASGPPTNRKEIAVEQPLKSPLPLLWLVLTPAAEAQGGEGSRRKAKAVAGITTILLSFIPVLGDT